MRSGPSRRAGRRRRTHEVITGWPGGGVGASGQALRYNPATMSLLWVPINVMQALLAALWSLVCAVAAILLSKVTRSPRPGLFIAKSVWSPVLLGIGGVRAPAPRRRGVGPSSL